jgi:hypothetical protein
MKSTIGGIGRRIAQAEILARICPSNSAVPGPMNPEDIRAAQHRA